MFTFLLVLIFLAAIVLIFAVLAQNPKGGGLSSAFGGSSATQFIGVKKTTDLLEKITWGAASVIMILAVVANMIATPDNTRGDASSLSPNVRKAQEAPSLLEESNLDLLKSDTLLTPTDTNEALPLDFETEEGQ